MPTQAERRQRLFEVASSQGGYFTAAQARALGYDTSTVAAGLGQGFGRDQLSAAARALTLSAGSAAQARLPSARRLVSEAKRFATETAWEVVNLAMQIVGGIGYTNVFPIERLLRDTRLTQIWTGTNEIMNLLIQHEYYREVLGDPNLGRQVEADAAEADAADEKVYEDEEMWVKGW